MRSSVTRVGAWLAASAELGRLATIPTLVVSAGHDPISPPSVGRALANAIPGAHFELLPDQAHGAPVLAAEAVNALLLEHLQRAEAAHSSRPA